MKKFLALILALTMVMSLGAVAFAADITGNGGDDLSTGNTAQEAVKVTVEQKVTTNHKYRVEVTWGDLTFKYTLTGERTWNPTNHTYTIGGSGNFTGTWDKESVEINVANHSDLPVKVSGSYAGDGTAIDGVDFELTNSSEATLAKCEVGQEPTGSGVTSMTLKLQDESKTPSDFDADSVTISEQEVGHVTIKVVAGDP